MKKLSFLFICLVGSFSLIAQAGDNWYKALTGKIGAMPSTMHLHKGGDSYSGYIWFAQNQMPMFIYYNVPVVKTDSTEMSAVSGPVSLVLKGILNENSFSGKSLLSINERAPKSAPFSMQLSTDKTFTPLSYISTNGSAGLPAQYKNDSKYEYSSAAVWPAGGSPYEQAIKKMVMQMLGIKTPVTNLAKWMTDEKNKGIDAWKKDNMKMSPKEVSEMGSSLSVQLDSRIMVIYENERNITLANYVFSFAGGAHGGYNTALVNINKKDGKKMLLSDVINPAGVKLLPAILDRVARLQYGVKNNGPLDKNGFLVNTIPVTENFFVTSVGIGFLYAPYEIKSFADGEVSLVVPFTALNTWLQPGFKK